eukprot:TRINITY_DN34049_c0_g1_i1.p1 TRINITY_DN34049_c0_g1~~TRINITY_DN34049_c0_g1_i1.p1  ORF type:complete len:148 (-),score=3.41 TRINITY_DN34049_c0_g1_i1:140-583(-)
MEVEMKPIAVAIPSSVTPNNSTKRWLQILTGLVGVTLLFSVLNAAVSLHKSEANTGGNKAAEPARTQLCLLAVSPHDANTTMQLKITADRENGVNTFESIDNEGSCERTVPTTSIKQLCNLRVRSQRKLSMHPNVPRCQLTASYLTR